MTNSIPIVVDGPNFINRILDMGIDKDILSKQLVLTGLRDIVNDKLHQLIDTTYQCEIVEFVCSKKLFGQTTNKFIQGERDALVRRFAKEVGVHVEEVNLPGSSEKGVDTTIAAKIETFAENFPFIVLVSEDRDFVPLLKKMREKGVKVVVVSTNNTYPTELINEAYAEIELDNDYRPLFKYEYPKFFVYKFTLEDFRQMISNADGRTLNQVRINSNGLIYISMSPAVGNRDLIGVKTSYETSAPYNEYVGPKAASDKRYIKAEYDQIKLAWKSGVHGYIDHDVLDETEKK